MAPDAPTSHTIARCTASTPGAALVDGIDPSAVAAYAIVLPTLVSVLVLRHQRQRRLQENVQVEQHRPVLDVIEVELDALLDLLVGIAFAAPAVDLGPAGNPRLDPVAGEIAVDGLVEQPALQLALHRV